MGRENLGSESKKHKTSKDWTLATSLEFDCRKKPVDEMDSELPMLPNLTDLVLGAGYAEWEWLSKFLEKSPRLERLVFKEGYQNEHFYGDDEYVEGDSKGDDKPLLGHPPQNVPSCLNLNLKVIQFVNFQGDDYELKIVEYFLKNAEVLEKLIISNNDEVGTCFDMTGAALAITQQQLEVTTKLLMLPRCSKACQVEFVSNMVDDFDNE